MRATRGADDPKTAATFPQLVRASAAAYGDDIAIACVDETLSNIAVSFSQLDRLSADLARGLIAHGAGKGTRIGFILGNGPSFAITLAAIARIGAIAIPISTFVKSDELVRVVRQSDICGLIVQRKLLGKDYVDRLWDAVPELRECDGPDLRLRRAPYLRWIVVTEGDSPPAIRSIADITARACTVSETLLSEIESEVHATDQMIEIYTSGSMALPKGVKHNHGPVLSRTHYIRSKGIVERGMKITAPMPMFWVGGLLMYLLPNWEIGATTICSERTFMDSRMAVGAVPAAEDVPHFPQFGTIWALGMTETLGPYSSADVLRASGFPVCPPLDHVTEGFEMRVQADGKDVEDGQVGEIQLRGYALTPGLHKEERSERFEPDGFYRTGDLGLVEGDRVHFVGRAGDMIKTAGSNVSPAEVEMEMQQLMGIHSAYVVGLQDPERGQVVVAGVVPRDGVTLDFEDIERRLRERLSSYKVPRAYVTMTRDEVPMLPSNKVARREIELMLARRLGRA